MNQRVEDHIARFNTAQRSGDWGPFLAAFTDDAVMTFEGVPIGPLHGRDAIADAYATHPPTDTMTAHSAETDGDTDRVRFAWDAGGTGTLTLRWRDSQIAALHVAFDAPAR
jgi:steroid delta-isomerase